MELLGCGLLMSSEGGSSDVEAGAHYQVATENHAPDAAFLSSTRPSQELVIPRVDIQAYQCKSRRIALGAFPVQRLKALVNALTS